MRVTLDTNTLVSGTFWTGDSFKILDMIDKKKLISVLSNEIIDEYNKILGSDEIVEKIKNKKLIMLKIAQKIVTNSIIIEPKIRLDIVKEDKNDNKIIECAIEGNADFIISNDNHLLKIKEFKNIKMITPYEFLKNYKKYI